MVLNCVSCFTPRQAVSRSLVDKPSSKIRRSGTSSHGYSAIERLIALLGPFTGVFVGFGKRLQPPCLVNKRSERAAAVERAQAVSDEAIAACEQPHMYFHR